jgi:rare lipoprotein A
VLGFRNRGTARVRVQYLGPAPLNDQGTHLASMNRHLDSGEPVKPVLVADKKSPAVAASAVAAPAVAASASAPPTLNTSQQQAPVRHDTGYYVQVASFSDPSNAGRAEATLASLGPVVITPVDVERGRFYRVQVGPLDDQATAHAALARVHAAGHHDARVVVARN